MDESLICRLARACLRPVVVADVSERLYTEALDNVIDAIRGAYARGAAQASGANALLEAWLTLESPVPIDLVAKTMAYVQAQRDE